MIGRVDSGGRLLLEVSLRAQLSGPATSVEAWIDTGFTGDLVLPMPLIERMKLDESGSVDATLADGRQLQLSTYTCRIEWFGTDRNLEVIANAGEYPLLGVGLLLGLELLANYRTFELTLS